MFCKFCGKQIDRKTMQCVSCGKPVGSLEGGVGFWDLVGEKPAESHATLPVNNSKVEKNSERMLSRQAHLDKRITVLSTMMIGMLAFSIILNVILLSIALGLKKDYEYLINSIQIQTEQENAHTEVQNTEEGLSESASVEETVQEAATESMAVTELEQAEGLIVITKQPEDVSVSENIEAGEILFSLKAEGEGLTFQWQKYDAKTEEWESIDSNLFEVQNGNTGTELILKSRSEEIYGDFRCVITDANNESTESQIVEIHDPNDESTESQTAEIYDPNLQGVE